MPGLSAARAGVTTARRTVKSPALETIFMKPAPRDCETKGCAGYHPISALCVLFAAGDAGLAGGSLDTKKARGRDAGRRDRSDFWRRPDQPALQAGEAAKVAPPGADLACDMPGLPDPD